ncbi:MAG: hypothetical protein O7H41_16065 [Planctomycetota bacterium]|nr:hypothetical protein [Planctomycetota bacterium]
MKLMSVAAPLLLTLSLTGCAAMRAAQARTEYTSGEVMQHVYDKDLQQIWPEVRSFLFEQGYQVKSVSGDAGYNVETEWKQTVGTVLTRYLVQGIAVDDGKCRVNFMKVEKRATFNPEAPERDWEMEFKLLDRLDPARSQEIQKEAQAKGEAARS